MRELSLHILDIVQNSISAKATQIWIEIQENRTTNHYLIQITDNGCGMTSDQLARVTDPFFTSRTTRPVGMGIPLFKATAEQSGGSLQIESQPGVGTRVTAIMQLDHINRPPLGKMAETIQLLILSNPEIHFSYSHRIDERQFEFDTHKFPGYIDADGNIDFMMLDAMKNYFETRLVALLKTEDHAA
ncbi:ATP-binding protein [candidate division KSB1 bacterium]|nr:ATP-binding protein [candidate division KSB1 bacterium]